MENLLALSPIDGRYAEKADALRDYFSEYAFMKHRVEIEVRWFIFLLEQKIIPQSKLESKAKNKLTAIFEKFNLQDAEKIKAIEKKTNHDVKAVEYFVKEKITAIDDFKKLSEWIHFGCTSEDINNLAYGLMVKRCREQILFPKIEELIKKLTQFAKQNAEISMLSRTHGQAASPTTVGKEFANVVWRLQQQLKTFSATEVFGKFNGAVGNYNAHLVAFPKIDWFALSKKFVTQLGLVFNPLTTQIEPHDGLAALFHALIRINTVLIDLCRDCWGYISLGYFQQKMQKDEVGSSTMPHKINPIDFENAEGNLSLANAILDFLALRLPTSRFQRDLVDSTLLRNMGVSFAHSFIAYENLLRGLNKIAINQKIIQQDLTDHWELLGEAVQTVMRKNGIENPYEKLKALTRGEKITQQDLKKFIESLALNAEDKKILLALTPENYIGLAKKLAKM